MVISKEDTVLSFGAAAGTAICALVFGVSLILRMSNVIDYVSSMGIAICFLALTVAHDTVVSEHAVYARLAVAFACVYCTLVCLVYFTQLSFVRLAQEPGPGVLSIVSFEPPRTVFFAIDMLGYFFMSLSVCCMGLTLPGGSLKRLFIILGLWGATCIAVPLLPFMYDESADKDSSEAGIASLVVWTLFFVPLMTMLANYYRQEGSILLANKRD
jgi:hypothetical protein